MSDEQGRLGRRLLATRNRLRGQSDPDARRKLQRKEVRLLVALGNLQAAETAAMILLDENPGLPAALSVLADLACRSGRWDRAEELFRRASEGLAGSGDREGADRLRTGPLYRLAEAREDYDECAGLSSGEGELKAVLAIRCARMAGRAGGPDIPRTEDWLASRLARLEDSWRGSSPDDLLDIAVQWQGTEPEWRWRFIVEGAGLWEKRGLDPLSWSRPVRETACPVLDPRFHEEWRRFLK
ncbi:MAG: hypothetical protein JXA64_07215 [Candidatus Fermentibacteraceae bacterium]|nr:hypothetical protein [Candidatus Fermentibacteraceae bacterium]MBN2608889.1 hypothetical protein [Candidatus Fermentibacteraceae bacterium]